MASEMAKTAVRYMAVEHANSVHMPVYSHGHRCLSFNNGYRMKERQGFSSSRRKLLLYHREKGQSSHKSRDIIQKTVKM